MINSQEIYQDYLATGVSKEEALQLTKKEIAERTKVARIGAMQQSVKRSTEVGRFPKDKYLRQF